MDRRTLITGLISLVAAPSIVRAGSLMPVKQKISDPLAKVTFCENRMLWISGPQEISCSPPLSPEMQALLQARVNAAFGILRRSVIANMEKQLFHSTGPNPLLGAFE